MMDSFPGNMTPQVITAEARVQGKDQIVRQKPERPEGDSLAPS